MQHVTNNNSTVPTPSDVAEKVVEAVKGEDEPMGRTHPTAPAGLVFLTFPIALVVIFLSVLVASVVWSV